MKNLKIYFIILPFLLSLLFGKPQNPNSASPTSDIQIPITNYSLN